MHLDVFKVDSIFPDVAALMSIVSRQISTKLAVDIANVMNLLRLGAVLHRTLHVVFWCQNSKVCVFVGICEISLKRSKRVLNSLSGAHIKEH
jgi:hypothetical protein